MTGNNIDILIDLVMIYKKLGVLTAKQSIRLCTGYGSRDKEIVYE